MAVQIPYIILRTTEIIGYQIRKARLSLIFFPVYLIFTILI